MKYLILVVSLSFSISAMADRASELISCSEKIYSWLPGSGDAVKEKAMNYCKRGQTADEIIPCTDKIYAQLPGSGDAVKEKALNICTGN